jgi:predicted O-methyltransferase YrrM
VSRLFAIDELTLPEGRLWPDDEALLYRYACGCNTVIDIGTFMGRSAVIMAQNARRVYTIDVFWEQEGFPDYDYDIVRERLKAFSNVTVLKGRAEELANIDTFTGRAVDLVFVDDGHQFFEVYEQTAQWLPKVRPGGVVLYHDYDAGHYEVIRGVHEYLASGQLVAVEQGRRILVTRKPW